MDQDTRRFDQEPDQPTHSLDEDVEQFAPGTQVCAKCGGAVMRLRVGMDTRNGEVAVKRPGVWFGVLSGGMSRLRALTCIECGYTELYAVQIGDLMDNE